MSAPLPDLFVATFPLEELVPPAQLRREAAVEISRMAAAGGCTFAPTAQWELRISKTAPKRVTVIAPARTTRPRAELEGPASEFIRDIEGTAPALAERCRAHMAGGGVGRESRAFRACLRPAAHPHRSVRVLAGPAGRRPAG